MKRLLALASFAVCATAFAGGECCASKKAQANAAPKDAAVVTVANASGECADKAAAKACSDKAAQANAAPKDGTVVAVANAADCSAEKAAGKACCSSKTAQANAAPKDGTVVKASSEECAAQAAACCPMWSAMKGLEGTWQLVKGNAHGEELESGSVTYKVTSAGSVLVETLFPGTEHEMITVYHMEGENMVVTHYCALGNQPVMKSTADSKPGHVVFAFTGGANVDKNGLYMGGLKLEIIDENTIRHEWTSFNAGQPADKAVFEFKRTGKKA